jgi:hypothetical protein
MIVRTRTAVFAATMLGLSACGESWAEHNVRVKAADAFRCDEDKVKVEEWGPNTYRARGCKKTATYTCVQGGGSTDTPTCTREK